jgi:hypothetical protein
LAALRPNHTLTELDELLRLRLASLDARCLYLTYGPSVLAHCTFCNSDEPYTYFYYSLPEILFPHALNLIAIGTATSSLLSRKEGGRWRTLATMTACVLATADAYAFYSYDYKANTRALKVGDLMPFYWYMRVFRGVAIVLLDAGLAGLLWLSSTNRAFVVPPGAAERLETVNRTMESTRGKLGGLSIVRSVVSRNDNLRRKNDAYWRKEGEFMGEIMDEREVVEGMRNALSSGRINVANVEAEAGKFAEAITSAEAIGNMIPQ